MEEKYCTGSCIEKKKRTPMPVSGGRIIGYKSTWVDTLLIISYIVVLSTSLLSAILLY